MKPIKLLPQRFRRWLCYVLAADDLALIVGDALTVSVAGIAVNHNGKMCARNMTIDGDLHAGIRYA